MASICRSDVLKEIFGTSELTHKEYWKLAGDHRRRVMDAEPTKMSFPYLAEGVFDPPLPTVEDFVNAKEIIGWKAYGNTRIRRVSGAYVVKFSTTTHVLQEAENLLFLEKNSKVRTPKVFSVFTRHEEHPLGMYKGQIIACNYLIMEYIPGTQLSPELLSSFDDRQRSIVISKIAEQLNRLREVKLESPPYYGRINNQPWELHFHMLVCPGKDICGPYKTYEGFVDAMFDSAKLCAAMSHESEDFEEEEARLLTSFKQTLLSVPEEDKRPTLTHLDLHTSNIMLQLSGDDCIVTFIDWETLGWMPAWIEGVTILTKPFLNGVEETTDFHSELLRQGIRSIDYTAANFITECEDFTYQI